MHETQKELIRKKDALLQGGGKEKTEAQHKKGKLTARERINYLLDRNSFVEFGLFVKGRGNEFGMEKNDPPYDGVVTGFGKIDGRTVYVYAHDATVMGGSQGEMHSRKIAHLINEAIKNGKPVISLNDSSGARIQEGVDNQPYNEVVNANVRASGFIPQIAGVLGPCAGGGAYTPALSDIVIGVARNSYMFVTGPGVVKQVTGEIVTEEELGGALVHNSISGVQHRLANDDLDCIQQIKTALSFLPDHAGMKPPEKRCCEDASRLIPELDEIIPENRKKGFDIKKVLRLISDDGDIFEIQPLFAQNIVTALAHLNGKPVGYIANQPLYLAGAIDMDAADKAARFINLCDAFDIPLVFLADTPGCMPGMDQEHAGLLRHGAKMLYATSRASVPKITVILRKLYGGASVAMGDKGVGSDILLSWPTGECAVMGAEAAAKVIFRKQIASAEDPESEAKKLTGIYEESFCNPYRKAYRGYTDIIIEPRETRKLLIQCLETLENKTVESVPKKHGNMPC